MLFLHKIIKSVKNGIFDFKCTLSVKNNELIEDSSNFKIKIIENRLVEGRI